MNSVKAHNNGVKLPVPLWEFIAMMASLLALNALSIDTMIPALSMIGEYYQTPNENDQQLVIAQTFSMLLALRFIQGVFAAGFRVIATSIVRDIASGRTMASILSLIFWG